MIKERAGNGKWLHLRSAFIQSDLQSFYCIVHPYMHTHIPIAASYHTLGWSDHQKQFEFWFLAQGHFDMWTGEGGDLTLWSLDDTHKDQNYFENSVQEFWSCPTEVQHCCTHLHSCLHVKLILKLLIIALLILFTYVWLQSLALMTL